eukprot:3392443-Prymnesium_polylepis.2
MGEASASASGAAVQSSALDARVQARTCASSIRSCAPGLRNELGAEADCGGGGGHVRTGSKHGSEHGAECGAAAAAGGGAAAAGGCGGTAVGGAAAAAHSAAAAAAACGGGGGAAAACGAAAAKGGWAVDGRLEGRPHLVDRDALEDVLAGRAEVERVTHALHLGLGGGLVALLALDHHRLHVRLHADRRPPLHRHHPLLGRLERLLAVRRLGNARLDALDHLLLDLLELALDLLILLAGLLPVLAVPVLQRVRCRARARLRRERPLAPRPQVLVPLGLLLILLPPPPLLLVLQIARDLPIRLGVQ